MTEDIIKIFKKIFKKIQYSIKYYYDTSAPSLSYLFEYYYINNNVWNDYNITDYQKCELFISFIKYVKDNDILIDIYIPNDYNDIFSFFKTIYNKSNQYYNYFLRLFMSKYITLYTPKYFYDNLENNIFYEPYLYIFNFKKFLIIIKAFIDYKYIPINLILPNINKYITYLKLIKTDTEKDLIMKNLDIKFGGIFSIERKEKIYYRYIKTVEAITNELYFACSYRYVWIGAVIRGILFKYSCFD